MKTYSNLICGFDDTFDERNVAIKVDLHRLLFAMFKEYLIHDNIVGQVL